MLFKVLHRLLATGVVIWCALIGGCIFGCRQAFAEDWLVVSGLAKHLDGDRHCNSTTAGAGFERTQSANWRSTVGFYRNSQCRWSTYVAEAWMPLHFGQVHVGGIFGVVTGYRAQVMPAAGAAMGYEGKKYGLNLIFIPPYRDSGNVLWLQGKVRW